MKAARRGRGTIAGTPTCVQVLKNMVQEQVKIQEVITDYPRDTILEP